MAKKNKTYELRNEAGAGIRIRFRPENAYFLEQTTGKTFINDEDTRRLMRECFGRYMAQFRKLGDGELLAELRLGGEEMLSASFPYSTHGCKLSAKETAGYREKLKELEELGRDPDASERLRTIAEHFPVARLENDPDLFRIYRHDGEWRLAVIWGLTGVAGEKLRPVDGAQTPNPNGGAPAFAARLLPWLVALLIALLALLAWHEFGKNTVEGSDLGPGGEIVVSENGLMLERDAACPLPDGHYEVPVRVRVETSVRNPHAYCDGKAFDIKIPGETFRFFVLEPGRHKLELKEEVFLPPPTEVSLSFTLPPIAEPPPFGLSIGKQIPNEVNKTYDVPVTFSGLGANLAAATLTLNSEPVPVENADGQTLKALRPGKYVLTLAREIADKPYKTTEEFELDEFPEDQGGNTDTDGNPTKPENPAGQGEKKTGNGGQGENPDTGDDAVKPKERENPNANEPDEVDKSGIPARIDNPKNEESKIRTGTKTTVPTSPIPPTKDGEEGRNGDDGTGGTTKPGEGKNDGGDNPSPHPEVGEGSQSNTDDTGETAGAGNGENDGDSDTTSRQKTSKTTEKTDVKKKSVEEISDTPTPSMDFPVTARREKDNRVLLETPEGIGKNQKIIVILGEDGRELGSTDGKTNIYEIPGVPKEMKKLRLVGFGKNGEETEERVVEIKDTRDPNSPETEEETDEPKKNTSRADESDNTDSPPSEEPESGDEPKPPESIRGETVTNSGIKMEYTRLSDAERGELVVSVTARDKRIREIEYAGKSYPATGKVARIPDVSKDAADTKIIIRFDNDDRWTEDFRGALK